MKCKVISIGTLGKVVWDGDNSTLDEICLVIALYPLKPHLMRVLIQDGSLETIFVDWFNVISKPLRPKR